MDVFLASPLVGPSRKAIGIDMTPEMIERARTNAENGGYPNVEFHPGPSTIFPSPMARSIASSATASSISLPTRPPSSMRSHGFLNQVGDWRSATLHSRLSCPLQWHRAWQRMSVVSAERSR